MAPKYNKPRKSRKPRKPRKPATTDKLVKLIKSVTLKVSETKQKALNHGKIELNHNTPAVIAGLNATTINHMPSQGSGDNNRQGDKINVLGFKLKIMLGQKLDRPNVTWRLIVASCRPDYTYSYNTFFENATGICMLDKVNDDDHKVIMSKKYKPGIPMQRNDTTFGEYTFFRSLWVPRKKIYSFATNGGFVHNDRQLLLVCCAYDAFGSLVTDNIAYANVWQDLWYKDP